VPDKSFPSERAIAPWAKSTSDYYPQYLLSAAKQFQFSLETPYEELTGDQKHLLLYARAAKKCSLSTSADTVTSAFSGRLRE